MISSQRTAVILLSVTAVAAPLRAANGKTTINLSNKSGAVGETITLEASLLSAPPNPNANVLGREIKFFVDGKEACAGKIAALNLASCKWKVPSLTQGTKPLEARFAGDGTWAASKASAQILIVKATTKLEIGPTVWYPEYKNVVLGKPLMFRVELKRATDKEGIDGRVVSFNVDGRPAGKGKTALGGTVELEYLVPTDIPGDVHVEAFFEGDDSHVATSGRHTFPAPPHPGARVVDVQCGAGLTVAVHILIEAPGGISKFSFWPTWGGPTYDFRVPIALSAPYPTRIDRIVTLDERSPDSVDRDHEWGLEVEGPGFPEPMRVFGLEPRGADGKQRCPGHYRK